MQNNRDNFLVKSIALLISLALFLSFVIDMTGETLRSPAYFFAIIIIIIIGLAFRKNFPKNPIPYILGGGIFVKVSYILYTPIWERQHDVISFGAGEGHAAYIEYILNNKALPNFDPRLVWGFFQPPLHHFVSAAWMWINIRLKIAERQLQENVQVLTLMYMCIVMLATYYICKELSMKKKGTILTMLIVSFHPAYILLSGSINNDALSIAFTALALFIAVYWYKKPNFIGIILLALSIGLGMMTKLSAGLIAPGIGLMMLYKLYADRKNIIKYLIWYVCFGLIVFPLGLWWPIRNKILWDMPANYIPEVGEQLTHPDLFSRLLDVRTNTVYTSLINNGDAYDEYNFFLAMIKTSLFGESDFGQISPVITIFAFVLFITSIILIILSIIAMVKILFNKESSLDLGLKILLGVSAISIFGGYFSFAISYNNFSAQDFRYAALLISIMSIFLGLYDDRLDAISESKNIEDKRKSRIKVYRQVTMVAASLFALSAACVYILVGIL